MEDPLSLNLYAYARENPERYTDTNGHAYLDEDGVYYTPSGAALVASGQISSTYYTDPHKVSYTPVTTATAVGTGVKSSDARLAQEGLGYGGPDAVVGFGEGPTGSSMTIVPGSSLGTQVGGLVLQGLRGAAGAAVVAGAAIGTALAAAAIVGNPLGQALIIGSLAIGAGFALGYVIKNGPDSTPGGAINAFEEGATAVPEAIHLLWNQLTTPQTSSDSHRSMMG